MTGEKLQPNEALNISRLENALHGVLQGHVSENVYAGTPPTTLPPGIEDFVVVEVVKVEDLSFGRQLARATVNVMLYAKEGRRGEKNVPLLDKMETAAWLAVDRLDLGHYSASELYRAHDYEAKIGFHMAVLALSVAVY